ncbi:hypothetical protein [Bradyrhizobium sp. Arg816]|uniref:hypothetical protein n=1 Tax=Bradyrhizobium sp. Arg816 TaxID=2998491 RepID=UPI00249DE4B4|nr:hypothetical protein [Bradyrhizobium sp. Arg816]MDI3563532.1 hypothetical protein [Bradyrhizobium sp. Arg816]
MSYHTRRYTAEYWDHRRDERKHDSLPHRLDRNISTAIDIVLLVRLMDNIENAAALIDLYADSKAEQRRLEAVAAGAGA